MQLFKINVQARGRFAHWCCYDFRLPCSISSVTHVCTRQASSDGACIVKIAGKARKTESTLTLSTNDSSLESTTWHHISLIKRFRSYWTNGGGRRHPRCCVHESPGGRRQNPRNVSSIPRTVTFKKNATIPGWIDYSLDTHRCNFLENSKILTVARKTIGSYFSCRANRAPKKFY